MKLSQIEKQVPQTLTNSKDIIQKTENMLTEVAGPDQRQAKKMRPENCTKKLHPAGVLGDLSGDQYIICPKPPSPAGKILDRRQLFFLANHNSPEQTPHTRLNLNGLKKIVK